MKRIVDVCREFPHSVILVVIYYIIAGIALMLIPNSMTK